MCGISVVVALQGASHKSKQSSGGPYPANTHAVDLQYDAQATQIAKELDDSLDLIAHRGPDSRGQWISPDKRVGARPRISS